MDSILETITFFFRAILNILVYLFSWFLPVDGSLSQIVISIFKIGAVLVLVFIFYDNARDKSN